MALGTEMDRLATTKGKAATFVCMVTIETFSKVIVMFHKSFGQLAYRPGQGERRNSIGQTKRYRWQSPKAGRSYNAGRSRKGRQGIDSTVTRGKDIPAVKDPKRAADGRL